MPPHVDLGKALVPRRYIPKTLSLRDQQKQKALLKKSRSLYKRGQYYERPKVKSFVSKPSGHVKVAEELYGVDSVEPSAKFAKATQCTRKALEKIVSKGRGAYYSSGSRPNQTAESWGLARLASAVSGGNAAIVDYDILKTGCKPTSPALRLATQTCRRQKKCKKYTQKKYSQ